MLITKKGGSDGTRTHDLRRDRPSSFPAKSTTVPTFAVLIALTKQLKIETYLESPVDLQNLQHGGLDLQPMTQPVSATID
jgi:hypothetical protein